MTKTVVGTYRDMDSAYNVVNKLVDAGFNRNDMLDRLELGKRLIAVSA